MTERTVVRRRVTIRLAFDCDQSTQLLVWTEEGQDIRTLRHRRRRDQHRTRARIFDHLTWRHVGIRGHPSWRQTPGRRANSRRIDIDLGQRKSGGMPGTSQQPKDDQPQQPKTHEELLELNGWWRGQDSNLRPPDYES